VLFNYLTNLLNEQDSLNPNFSQRRLEYGTLEFKYPDVEERRIGGFLAKIGTVETVI